MENSKAFSLNINDFKKLGINGFLVGLAAGLTYVGANISELDLGSTGLVAVPIISILLNAAVKWTKSNQIKDDAKPAE